MSTLTILVLAFASAALIIIGFYFHWTKKSLENLIESAKQSKSMEKSTLEEIVHTRTSLNLIYALITVFVAVASFLGWNLKDDIKNRAVEEIIKESQIPLEAATTTLQAATANTEEVERVLQRAAIMHNQIKSLTDSSATLVRRMLSHYSKMRQSPQKLYVVEQYPLKAGENRIKYSEIQRNERANSKRRAL